MFSIVAALSDIMHKFSKVNLKYGTAANLQSANTPVIGPNVRYGWLDGSGRVLQLFGSEPDEMSIFLQHWSMGKPVVVSGCHQNVKPYLWTPESFIRDFPDQETLLISCTDNVKVSMSLHKFWHGFRSTDSCPSILKLKDWPPDHDLKKEVPDRYDDIMKGLP